MRRVAGKRLEESAKRDKGGTLNPGGSSGGSGHGTGMSRHGHVWEPAGRRLAHGGRGRTCLISIDIIYNMLLIYLRFLKEIH